MVDRNLMREYLVDDAELELTMGAALREISEAEELADNLYSNASEFDVNQLVKGIVLRIEGEEVLVDIGYKSEGIVHLSEWGPDERVPLPGEEIEVLLEEVEDDFGLVLLSKRKADRARDWVWFVANFNENDRVEGTVVRKIKGGLLVNIARGPAGPGSQGVNLFLPASQVDIRRPSDIGDYMGRTVECVILKIDETRKNVVVSRRKLIEDVRTDMKKKLLAELEVKQIRKGTVKNIADFGAFVDLGGIDGLLHITDMSWSRIGHPTEMVRIDDEIEVMVLHIDRDKEKIALGLKQKLPSPWDEIDKRYPVGARIQGEVVNVMSYGAFVKLEDGIEGLVHISEMSWTKRVSHPSELVKSGDPVEVVVLGINTDKQEISLGMKQTQPNPWDNVTAKYPIGQVVTGTVRNLTNYGAFIELEEGVDGLLHVSDMSWTRKISHASEMLKKGDSITCQVISVDEQRKRIALGLKQMDQDPWSGPIPERYAPGTIVHGKVTKITNFGVFVELEEQLEGLLHVSELSDQKVANPEEVVKVGDTIEVKVLRVDTADRKIGLSRKLDAPIEEMKPATGGGNSGGGGGGGPAAPTGPRELKGGMGITAGPLFSMGGEGEPVAEPSDEAPAAESTEEAPEADEPK